MNTEALAAIDADLDELNDDKTDFGAPGVAAIVPLLRQELLPGMIAGEYRQAHGRPLRALRMLAGLSVGEVSELLRWSREDVEAAERLSSVEMHALKWVQGVATLALAVGVKLDQEYGQRVWGNLAGEAVRPVGLEDIKAGVDFHLGGVLATGV